MVKEKTEKVDEVEGLDFSTRTKIKVPIVLSSIYAVLACGALSLGIAWVVNNYRRYTLDNGLFHSLLMTLFIIFTSIGATAFRVFTFVPRRIAKVFISENF
jgi:hypothetical protein